MTEQPFNPWKMLGAGDGGDEPAEQELYEVMLPSGTVFTVLTEQESELLALKIRDYASQYAFDNVADLATLDNLLINELMQYRLGQWLSRRKDYDGKPIDEDRTLQRLKELSAEGRMLKKQTLGIDKVTRDRTRGEGSPAQRMMNVLERAHRMMVHRNEQAYEAIEGMMQLAALMTAKRNCEDEDDPDKVRKAKQKLRVTDDELFEWIERRVERFHELDATFRREHQTFWVQDQ